MHLTVYVFVCVLQLYPELMLSRDVQRTLSPLMRRLQRSHLCSQTFCLQMSCASPVYIPSLPHTNGVGVQHLLVCASSPSHGHVSVVSLPYTHPIVTESFKACDTGIVCAEAVTGCGRKTDSGRFLFHEDTVWLGTMDAE